MEQLNRMVWTEDDFPFLLPVKPKQVIRVKYVPRETVDPERWKRFVWLPGEIVILNDEKQRIGGPGSGFFGHRGRKGQVGGSRAKAGSITKGYRAFDSNDSGRTVAWASELMDEKVLARDEVQAVRAYKASSTQLNEYLRFGTPTSNGRDTDVPFIDSAIDKSPMPENVVTYRGIDILNVPALYMADGTTVGREFTDKGFPSTTLHERSALGWSWNHGDKQGTVMKILMKSGQKALYLDALFDRGEYELLLPRATKFRVIVDEMVPERWTRSTSEYRLLTVEIVP